MANLWKCNLLFKRQQLWNESENSFIRLVHAYNYLRRLSYDGILFSDNVYDSLSISLHSTHRPSNVKGKKP